MKYFEKVPAVMLLEDGTVYHGMSAGKIGTTTGEVCFNTGMTGYQEIFTDPSYFGQIMVTTNAHIGNYGVLESESEWHKMSISGLVCKNFTNTFSRKQTALSLQEYFLNEGIVGISDVDTRSLVRHIRNKGAMNAIISSEELDIDKLKKKLAEVPSMEGLELSSKVTCSSPNEFGKADSEYKVAVIDLGVKNSILNNLSSRGCRLKVFPAKTTLAEMQKWNPDGYFFSNGPGDPASTEYATETLKEILATKKPFFGICLGHQIFARALGLPTYKMHNGHRGLNHPVKNLNTGRCEITTQNHGFGVVEEAVQNSKEVDITHINLNDNSVEGIRHKTLPAFSVQYHPEASPGPHDSRYLFDEFVSEIKKSKKALSV